MTITGTIPTKTANNLSASGATVTVPAGYYASQVTKSVASLYIEFTQVLPVMKYAISTTNGTELISMSNPHMLIVAKALTAANVTGSIIVESIDDGGPPEL